MYFVSESDSDYDAALKVFDELKKEYDGKIEFQLHDITKDKEILERFSIVDGNTPALIMDGKELGLQFKTTDKNVLAGEIRKIVKINNCIFLRFVIKYISKGNYNGEIC